MYNFIYFLLFLAIFSSAIILFFLIKKDQEKKAGVGRVERGSSTPRSSGKNVFTQRHGNRQIP